MIPGNAFCSRQLCPAFVDVTLNEVRCSYVACVRKPHQRSPPVEVFAAAAPYIGTALSRRHCQTPTEHRHR